MRYWTFTLKAELNDASEVTFWEHGMSCIHWRYDGDASREPDSCRVVLNNGQMIDLRRENARRLYHDLVAAQD